MPRRNPRRLPGPSSTHFGRLPTGPAGPRPRPTSWAAGMAPFGWTSLLLVPSISGGHRGLGAARRAEGGPRVRPIFRVGTA